MVYYARHAHLVRGLSEVNALKIHVYLDLEISNVFNVKTNIIFLPKILAFVSPIFVTKQTMKQANVKDASQILC